MPNTANTRRDPQKGKKGFSKNKGFTLIELMIAVGVLAVIMSLALPSYRTLIEKRQVTSSAEQISAFLSAAKMEAVKRNQNVRLSSDTDADEWCVGFASYAANADPDAACDCTVTDPTASGACAVRNLDDSAPELKVIRASLLAEISDIDAINIGSAASDVVSFDPIRGMLRVDGAIEAFPIEIQLSSKQDQYAMNVRVSATGRVTLCSDASRTANGKSVPGYEDCGGG